MFQERTLLHESPWNLLNGKKQSNSEITGIIHLGELGRCLQETRTLFYVCHYISSRTSFTKFSVYSAHFVKPLVL